MKLPGQLNRVFRVPQMTRVRIALALAAALLADGLQLLLGFFGWVGADQAVDVITAGFVSALVGFHWLLLPTFVLEFIPLVDDLPTWTACTVAVIALRKRGQSIPPSVPPPLPKSD